MKGKYYVADNYVLLSSFVPPFRTPPKSRDRRLS